MTGMVELNALDASRFASDRKNADSAIPAGTARRPPPNACIGMDDADRMTARYLVRRLGTEAAGYAERLADRLAAAGRQDKAAAWSAIAEAIADALRRPGTDDLRLKAAQCRRLAGEIVNAADPTRARLLDLAVEFDSKSVAAIPSPQS